MVEVGSDSCHFNGMKGMAYSCAGGCMLQGGAVCSVKCAIELAVFYAESSGLMDVWCETE